MHRQPPAFVQAIAGSTRAALPALLGYAGVRLFGLVVLGFWAHSRGVGLRTILGQRYDAQWLIGIAANGYDHGVPLQSDMAFFPLYPALVHIAGLVSPLGISDTGIVVAWVCGLAAAWGLFAVGALLHDARTGVVLAVLWGALPHAIVESMAYTESLFIPLAAWSLYALLTRRWLTAGVLCVLAGLTRPTGVALIAVICIAAIVQLVRSRGRGWRVWAALVVAPLGWMGYLLWVAQRTGRIDGWFHIQSVGWNSSFGDGSYTLGVIATTLGRPSTLDFYAVTMILFLSVVLLVISVLRGQPWELVLFSALILVLAITADGYFNSKARLILPAFGLLLPIASAVAQARVGVRITVLVAFALVSAYFGGYLMLIWNYSP